ncbi:MAG: PAS domain-containing protein [bacterium]
MLTFPTGNMTPEEIETIFNTLPVDITFVDKADTVRYFSKGKDRIFVRTPAVIGRKVQNCHPQKSVHIVNQILEDFKAGKKDSAAFWLTLNGKFIYIRYFAMRNNQQEYLGCLEVSQDVTEIRKLEGEKRLL